MLGTILQEKARLQRRRHDIGIIYCKFVTKNILVNRLVVYTVKSLPVPYLSPNFSLGPVINNPTEIKCGVARLPTTVQSRLNYSPFLLAWHPTQQLTHKVIQGADRETWLSAARFRREEWHRVDEDVKGCPSGAAIYRRQSINNWRPGWISERLGWRTGTWIRTKILSITWWRLAHAPPPGLTFDIYHWPGGLINILRNYGWACQKQRHLPCPSPSLVIRETWNDTYVTDTSSSSSISFLVS